MANEFLHNTDDTADSILTKVEYESIGAHRFESQATGDIMYASSATQLSRLGVGATDTILSVQGGVPTWRTPANVLTDLTGQAGAAFDWNSQNLTSVGTVNTHTIPGGTDTFCMLAATQELDNKTIDSAVAKGTWTASGTWTIPAVTLNGLVTGGGNNITGIGIIYGNSTYLRIGDAGTTSNSLASEDDLMVTGKLEVDGTAYFDSTVTQTSSSNTNFLIRAGSGDYSSILNFGHGATAYAGFRVAFNFAQCLFGLTSAVGRQFVICDNAEIGQDFDHANQTTPTLFVQSGTAPDTANDEWISFTHDVTDGVIATGSGGIKFMPNADTDDYFMVETLSNVPTLKGVGAYLRIGDAQTTEHALASEDSLMVSADLEVYGIAYIDNINVGAGSLSLDSTGAVKGLTITSTQDAQGGATIRLYHDSASPAVADYSDIWVYGRDSGANWHYYHRLKFIMANVTDGAEESTFEIYGMTGGASNLAAYLTGAGGFYIDADVSTGDDPVALFDDYDDALVLRKGIQERNHSLLVEMGIFTRKDTGSGYMMHIQPMTRLLAGGIYQTRAMLESTVEWVTGEVETMNDKITRLELELAELKERGD